MTVQGRNNGHDCAILRLSNRQSATQFASNAFVNELNRAMNMITRELVGADAEELLLDQIGQHSGGIRTTLSAYDIKSAISAWMAALRGIEEFINVPMFGLEDADTVCDLLAIRLDMQFPMSAAPVRAILSAELAPAVIDRFVQTLMMAWAIGNGFRISGLEAGEELRTVAGAVGYFQSRRRQMVALLYCMPSYCTGTQSVAPLDALNVFLPVVEHSCVGLSSLYRQLIMARIHDDFVLKVGPNECRGNYSLETLNEMFLEPERVAITEVARDRVDFAKLRQRLPLPKGQIFSAAELCNDLMTMEASYAEFELGKTGFGPMAQFIAACCQHVRDDYYIEISSTEIRRLMTLCRLSTVAQRRLVYDGSTFEEAVNSFAPFITVGRTAITTVTLLSRFAYSWKTFCLNKIKRFQIRSGFIFEDEVKTALGQQGFVITDIKRIEGREFDVVAIKDNVVYNIQCKNNLLDLTRMEENPKLFVRYNLRLDKYYAEALRKEEEREKLLLSKLGLSLVKHVVMSKFPLATQNPRVMAFREISQFGSRFTDR